MSEITYPYCIVQAAAALVEAGKYPGNRAYEAQVWIELAKTVKEHGGVNIVG